MSQIRILIVEDERLYGDLLCEYLETLGYEPLGPAPTAAQGLALFDALEPDLVLLDIGLRGDVDGIGLATQLLARRRLPLIFITAFTDRATFERARAVGPVAFITKPFDALTVQNAVELALYNFGAPPAAPGQPLLPPPPPDERPDLLIADAFFLRDRLGLIKVLHQEVLYVEAGNKHAVLVRTNGHRHALRMALRDMVRLLDGRRFVQVHRSFAINVGYLESVNPVDFTLCVGGQTLPLGRSYKEELLRRLHLLEGPDPA